MLAVADRLYDDLHKDRPWHDGKERIWSKEFSKLTPWHYRDGVMLYLAETDENPDDDFLGQSVAQQTPGQDDRGNDAKQ